jgi:hypothetical protein
LFIRSLVAYIIGTLDSRFRKRHRPIAPRSPWQNGHAERLIGSLRRECLDHVVVFGERHLRHVLFLYMDYYNRARTHLSLNKDAPMPRPIEAVGRIHSSPILGGLQHHYVCKGVRLATMRVVKLLRCDFVDLTFLQGNN